MTHLDAPRIADPAVVAVAAFHACCADFERAIEARESAEAILRVSGLEPGVPAYDQARAALDLAGLDESERVWGLTHDARLVAAFAAVPQTMDGLRALAGLIHSQERQGVPAAMIEIGSASVQAGLARMPAVTAT